eukprot:5755163-Alexandrium_andersonii.AAC.1
MSASLVGSEMCIRDRRCLGRLARCRRPRWRTARSGGMSGRSPWRWPRPVSYTHLTLPTICSV